MKKRLPNLVNIAILTFITILIWVSFSIFRQVKKEPEAIVSPEVLIPLTPSLDTNAMGLLEGRVYYEQSEVEELFANITIPEEEEILPTATPLATPLAAPTETGAPVDTDTTTVEEIPTP